ncbi:epimerase [Pseudomonas hunanensis]|uniref:Epimerase n=1 Tax=Pseudomonas hunanensis TaxID=1247546 RepID=A0ABD6MUH0_9PSED|nr:epimerase [Pseudomonas hunanensis]
MRKASVLTLITGAGGFVGSALIEHLLCDAGPDDCILASDLSFSQPATDPRVQHVVGGLTERKVLEQLLSRPADRIFHLATVAGRQSVDNFALGKATNLDATIKLLEGIRRQGHCPRFVFASSAAVFSSPWPAEINDATLPNPGISYATHKLVGEHLINDYSRAGFLDGLSLRLPGIIARPAGSQTMLSAFLSDVFYAARAHQPFTLPMAAEAGTWVMSVKTCVENLAHAARLTGELPDRRNWTLPALYLQMHALIDALAECYGDEVRQLITCQTNSAVEAIFRQPPLTADGARRLGFIGDDSVQMLIRNVISANPALTLA